MSSVNDVDDLPNMLDAVQQAYLDSPSPGNDTGFPEPGPDFPEDDTPLAMDHGFPEPDPPEFPDDPYAVALEDIPPLPIATAKLHQQYLNCLPDPDPNVDESINFQSITSLQPDKRRMYDFSVYRKAYEWGMEVLEQILSREKSPSSLSTLWSGCVLAQS
jgi:hypothetical protein